MGQIKSFGGPHLARGPNVVSKEFFQIKIRCTLQNFNYYQTPLLLIPGNAEFGDHTQLTSRLGPRKLWAFENFSNIC